jgi:hypothetical protein
VHPADRPHYDYYFDTTSQINGGQRMATVLLYLSDVAQGASQEALRCGLGFDLDLLPLGGARA